MSIERRLAAGLAAALFGAAAALGWSAPAGADADSPAQRIAESLRESPVYVDPSLDSALPEEDRAALAEQIEESGEPIRVVLVPLVSGDAWQGDPDQLVGAVHDRMGGESASYLTLGSSDQLHGTGFPTEEGDNAHYAALAVSYENDFADVPIADRIRRAVEITAAGRGREVYERETARYEEEHPPEDGGPGLPEIEGESGAGDDGGSAWPTPAVIAAVIAAVAVVFIGALPVLWRRWSARVRVPALPQHAVFDNADDARRDEVAARTHRELVEVGERLEGADIDAGPEAATAAHQEALDAYAAAGKAYDAAQGGPDGLADLAGALVLLDVSEDALSLAEAATAGRRAPKRRAHCFFNPLHGTATRPTPWRAVGTRRGVTVPLCSACAAAVRDRRTPQALTVEHEGRRVPYYEVPAEESVWSATGYGALRGDLVQRILRGDLRRSG